MTDPTRRIRRWGGAAAAALILAAGWILPARLIGDGTDRYASPIERAVANDALDLAASTCMDNPAAGVLVRALRVSDVRHVAGSCTVGPRPDGPTGEYIATVRAHGPFGVPLRSMRATCGGQHVTC